MLEYASDLDQIPSPLFVSWHKDGNLRGCTGTFAEDGMLGATLARYCVNSAVSDRRFPPIVLDELPSLRCEVNLLSDFEVIQDPLDW